MLFGGPFDGEVREIEDAWFSRGLIQLPVFDSIKYAKFSEETYPNSAALNYRVETYMRSQFAVGQYQHPVFHCIWFHSTIVDPDTRNAALGSLFAAFLESRMEGYSKPVEPDWKGGLL